MPRIQKFNFIPVHQLFKPKQAAGLVVGYNPSVGLLTFNQKVNPEVTDYKGKFVQLFADLEKRTLAWVFAPKDWTKPEQLANFTQVKTYGETNEGKAKTICIYIPKNISAALRMTTKFKMMPVETYKPAEYLDNNLYYYINLGDVYTSESKELEHGQETQA